MVDIKDQKSVWEKLFLKKNRYGIEPSYLAKNKFKFIKTINAKNILELGCGEGRDSIFFAKEGLKVTSIDFSERAIFSFKEKIIEKHLEEKIKILRGDLLGLSDFKDNSFDVIYSNLGLHYFTNKETTKLFSEIYRILKEGGLLVFSVKSTSDKLYCKGRKIEPDMYGVENHIRHFFSKEYLLSKIRKFEIVNIEPQNKPLPDGSSASTWNVVVKKG